MTEPGSQPTLSQALTREHREIDGSIEAFISKANENAPFAQVMKPLRGAIDSLRRHIYLEEEFVFPAVRESGLMMPVMVMEREHGELWRAMDELEAKLDEHAEHEPDDDVRTDLIRRCHEMLALQDTHNSKEEPIIYPHADTDMGETDRADLRDFMATGTMPDEWVCAQA